MLNCDYDSKACHVQFFIKIKFLTTSKPASNNICLLFPSYNPSVSLYFFCEFFFFIFSTSFMLVNYLMDIKLSFFFHFNPFSMWGCIRTRDLGISVSHQALWCSVCLSVCQAIFNPLCFHQSFILSSSINLLNPSILLNLGRLRLSPQFSSLSLFPHKTFVSLYSSIFLFLLINPQSLFLFLLYPSFCYFSISISISPLFILYLLPFYWLSI